MPTAFRDRIPALVLVALLHVLAITALLHAVIVERAPHREQSEARETQIALMHEAPALPLAKPRRRRPAAGGSTAITAPVFNPYTYNIAPAAPGASEGIATALAACDPGRYDMASAEVRVACDRIGALLKNDPGHFGFTSEVTDPQHWSRELARREAPYLAPCMTPNGPNAIYALTCIYKLLFGGYDSETRPRYSQ